MCLWWKTSAFLLLATCQYAYRVTGDPVMYFPPFELRTVKSGQPFAFTGNDNLLATGNAPMNPMSQQASTQPQFQVDQPMPHVPKSNFENHIDNSNLTFAEILKALTGEPEKKEKHAVARSAGYENPPYPPYDYRPPAYGYQQPNPYNYGPYASHQPYPNMYLHPSSMHYSPPKPLLPKLGLAKKDPVGLLTPAASKIASKISGIISFILALLTGSSPNSLEISSLKDIVVNGIIKPLFIAKGGLKLLLSKLTIPVIALLLINVEVLITIWWLWEDCPSKIPPPYYPPSPAYGYK